MTQARWALMFCLVGPASALIAPRRQAQFSPRVCPGTAASSSACSSAAPAVRFFFPPRSRRCTPRLEGSTRSTNIANSPEVTSRWWRRILPDHSAAVPTALAPRLLASWPLATVSLSSSPSTTTALPARLAQLALAGAALAVLRLALLRLVESRRALRARRAGDATSEWGRFAAQPGARALALLAGLLRMAPIVLRHRFARDASVAASLRGVAGARLADELIGLGPTYVKVGQIVSCRDNLLPAEYLQALTRLQDRVPAFSGERAAVLAAEALGRPLAEVFESFDKEPLAAASLGQVHRAVLTPAAAIEARAQAGVPSSSAPLAPGEGLEVAVKVQREGLRSIYDKDLALLASVAKGADRLKMTVGGADQKWADVFAEASEVLYREIDYRDEASNAARFADDFRPFSEITTPQVFPSLCTDRLLVMEYLPGTKVTDVAALDKQGYDRKALAGTLAKAYLYQFCKFGFFNTDPHPGNLAVDGGHPGGRLIFYDFGQACELSVAQQAGVLSTMEAIVDLDPDACVAAFQTLGVLKPNADLPRLREMVRKNFASGRIRSKASASSAKALPPSAPSSSSSSSSTAAPSSAAAASTAAVTVGTAALANGPGAVITAAPNGNKNNATAGTSSASSAAAAAATPATAEAAEVAVAEAVAVGVVEVADASAASRAALPDFTMPPQLAFVARALAQMEGVGKALDPDFEFIAAAAPAIPEMQGTAAFVESLVNKRLKGFLRIFNVEL